MPRVSPPCYSAEKRAFRETVMRKAVSADSRMPVEKFFFEGAWDKALSTGKQGKIENQIGMVRWAPSAVNQQPRRIIASDSSFPFTKSRIKAIPEKRPETCRRLMPELL